MIKIDDLKSEAAKVVGVSVLSLLRDNYTYPVYYPFLSMKHNSVRVWMK